jgi:hypothetical protein
MSKATEEEITQRAIEIAGYNSHKVEAMIPQKSRDSLQVLVAKLIALDKFLSQDDRDIPENAESGVDWAEKFVPSMIDSWLMKKWEPSEKQRNKISELYTRFELEDEYENHLNDPRVQPWVA